MSRRSPSKGWSPLSILGSVAVGLALQTAGQWAILNSQVSRLDERLSNAIVATDRDRETTATVRKELNELYVFKGRVEAELGHKQTK